MSQQRETQVTYARNRFRERQSWSASHPAPITSDTVDPRTLLHTSGSLQQNYYTFFLIIPEMFAENHYNSYLYVPRRTWTGCEKKFLHGLGGIGASIKVVSILTQYLMEIQ